MRRVHLYLHEARCIEVEVISTATEVIGGTIIASNYALKDKANQPITKIDDMVAGIWNNQEVVIFVEVKSHLEVSSAATKAIVQLELVSGYWDDPAFGAVKEWTQERDPHNMQAYIDLHVVEYHHRPLVFVVGAHADSISIRNHFC